jgi:hypothetical protein
MVSRPPEGLHVESHEELGLNLCKTHSVQIEADSGYYRQVRIEILQLE